MPGLLEAWPGKGHDRILGLDQSLRPVGFVELVVNRCAAFRREHHAAHAGRFTRKHDGNSINTTHESLNMITVQLGQSLFVGRSTVECCRVAHGDSARGRFVGARDRGARAGSYSHDSLATHEFVSGPHRVGRDSGGSSRQPRMDSCVDRRRALGCVDRCGRTRTLSYALRTAQ